MAIPKKLIAGLIASVLVMANAIAQEPATTTTELTTASATSAQNYAQQAAKSAGAAASSASAAASAVANKWTAPGAFFLYSIPILAVLGALLAVAAINSSLRKSPWSIADALSEEVDLPVIEVTTDPVGNKTSAPKYGSDGKPVLAPEMRASSSRLIALMGMVSILFLFIGFGAFTLFSFGSTGQIPEGSEKAVQFLLGGLTLFAPYVANKFASVFQGLSGGR